VHIKPATGIPNPSVSGRWLVPPWPAHAGVSEVAGHFLRFHLRCHDKTHELAYYEGYAAALAEATTRHLTQPADWRWFEELRDCVARCVAACKKERQG
jgi:hypothetical protein